MSSTFLGLNTAYTGLQAANAALNTTANNIANVETKGYSRQDVTTQAAEAIRSFTTYGCVGAGVDTLSIERIRDVFYDQKYWQNQSKLGTYEVKQYYMQCIEEYYKDDKTVKGFTTIFGEYSNALEELAKNPADTKYRQQMIGEAGNLATYFNDMYKNMQKLQEDVNHEIKANVDRINSIAEEIASLNKQINVIEMNSGRTANELRDQRDLLVDELSEIVDVEAEEQNVLDLNDLGRNTGGSRYLVKICGQSLVDANTYHTLTCIPRESEVKTNQTDVPGLFDIYFTGYEHDWTPDDYRKKGDALNINSEHSYGKLAGLIQMRDGNNNENFSGRVINVNSGVPVTDDKGDPVLDEDGIQLTTRSVTVEVSADYLKDLNKLNLTRDGGIITVASLNLYFTDWSYTRVDDGKAQFTFTLDDAKNKSRDGSLIEVEVAPNSNDNAQVGQGISYQGIPYYLSQMNEWVRLYSTSTNDILRSGTLDDGSVGHNMFVGDNDVSGKEFDLEKSDRITDDAGNYFDIKESTDLLHYMDKFGRSYLVPGAGSVLTDAEGKEYNVTDVKKDGEGKVEIPPELTIEDADGNSQTIKLSDRSDYYLLTAGNLHVADELVVDADLLATRHEDVNVKDGVEKNDIVKKLIQLGKDDTMMSFRGCSADQYLVTILGDVALNAERANKFTDSYTYMQKTISNQRLSVSGVDNDEEAVNLTKFQQQYNMASKMIQVLSEVYDRLINQTGV